MSSQFDRYQEMSALSARMVVAARCGDWDGLVDLEQRVAALRERLIEDDALPGANSRTGEDLGHVREMIQRILDDDAEIRRHTEPWMEQVKLLLSGHMSGWRVPADGPADPTSGAPGHGR